MEAAACGIPVVATAVGGVPELVQDGVTGLLTKAGDAEGLAEALSHLLCNSNLSARIGAAARHRAEEHFSLKRQVNRLLEMWIDLV
jgi:glycosyltransferase involved in cell wall biosynthesis